MLHVGSGGAVALIVALAVFFSAFNVMEATLPSLITKVAPPDGKGTAAGLFSRLHFWGFFAAGMVGGWVHQNWATTGLFGLPAALAFLWLIAAATRKQP